MKINKTRASHFVRCAEDVDYTQQKRFCAKIADICSPLKKTFNVSYFSQSRAFHNGSFNSIMTEPQLTEGFLKKQLPITFSEGCGFYLKEGYYIADCHAGNFGIKDKLNILWDDFKIGYMISIIKKYPHYDDMYSLGFNTTDMVLINKFINNMQIIERFLQYFQSSTLIMLNKTPLVTYSKEYFAPRVVSQTPFLTDEEKEDFLKNIPLGKVSVSGRFGEVLLSQREYECFTYAVTCYTLKEIAIHMSISPRTAETYLENVKDKLGVLKRSDLILLK